jgi:cytochrome c553
MNITQSRSQFLFSLLVVCAIAGGGLLSVRSFAQPAPAAAKRDYNWDVRPILADNCFRCHGPDAKSRQAGLRLDQKESAHGQALVPGNAATSEMIRRITSADPTERMPPVSSGLKALSAKDITTLTQWIQQGAEYKPHWAFVAPTRPARPSVRARTAGPIDRFILSKLEKEGLQPSAQANKETLINRVSLTLTGLPPTLAEVDAFLADKRTNAYETLVDRLLAAPQYGEHMAAYWMNIARYSDSDGFLDDHHDRFLWPYRDWVLSAFNRNMRFDQFSTWQIAGDLLPNPTREQTLATAFLRVGKRTTENGAIDEEYRVEYALDRANLIGGGFLALTTGCARCHDHKYDPIAQKDYYSLTGFFNSADEPGFHAPGFSTIQGGPTLPWTDAPTDAKIAAARAAVSQQEDANRRVREAALADATKTLSEWSAKPPSEIAAEMRRSIEAATTGYFPFETVRAIPDGELPTPIPPVKVVQPSLLSNTKRGGNAPPPGSQQDVARRLRQLPNSMIRENLLASPSPMPGVAPAVIEDAALRPGKFGNAMFFTETNRGMLPRGQGYYDRTQPFSFDLWIYPAAEYPNSQVLNHRDNDNSGGSGYKLNLEANHLSFYMMHSWPYNMLQVVSKKALPVKEWTHVTVTYDATSRAAGVSIYINGETAEVEVEHDRLTQSSLPRALAKVFNEFVGVEFGRRFREVTMKDGAIDELRFFNRKLTPAEARFLHTGRADASDVIVSQVERDPITVLSARMLNEAREAENTIVSWLPEVLVMADQPKPRQTYVLSRGLYNVHLDPVEPAPLTQVFGFDPALPRNRIGLTKWLFDPKNPLVARVFVNRLWQMQFGTGLVETADDFGMQGSRPSHPELLDWLAVDFAESGWDVKRAVKQIVMSATYRQASEASPDLLKLDPHNALLARGPRLRMSAEQVRDHALAVSGLLIKTIGGDSAYPYQPEGVWVAGVTQYDYPKPDQVSPDNHHRRSLYSFVKRNNPPPSMSVFDFSERHATIARRLTSNTPLQALVLLDDPQYVEAYRVTATNVLKQNDPDPVRQVFRLATRRWPRESEVTRLRSYFDAELKRFGAEPEKARQVVQLGVTPVDATLDAARLAALTNVVAAVMNTPDAYSIH